MSKFLMLALLLLLTACRLPNFCTDPLPPGCRCVGGLVYCDPPVPTPSPSPTPEPTPSPSPQPSPEPSPVSCPSVIWGEGLGKTTPTRARQVDIAVLTVKIAHPELFTSDGLFIVDWPEDPQSHVGEAKAKQFFLLVQKSMAAQGLCSYVFDELQVPKADGRSSEGYRLVNYNRGRIWDALNAYSKGDVAITLVPMPQPTAAPSPEPSPSPTACRLPLDPSRLRAKGRTRELASRFADATFEYYYEGIDNLPVGPCGRRFCDLGVDGGTDGAACADALIGTPQWSVAEGTMEIEPGFHGNPYFAKIVSGHGTVKVCSERLPTSCGLISVP